MSDQKVSTEKRWIRLYVLLAVVLAVIITGLYFFTKYFE
jgi:hypothetical protein